MNKQKKAIQVARKALENKTQFDLSQSVRDDTKDNANKEVIGKFKCETNNLPITEFGALHQKCYSFNHLKKDDTIMHTKKAKKVFSKTMW